MNTHPVYGLPLPGTPIVVCGVTFRPYRKSPGNIIRISDDFSLTAYMVGETYRSTIDGKIMPRNFRKLRLACYAAAKTKFDPPWLG